MSEVKKPEKKENPQGEGNNKGKNQGNKRSAADIRRIKFREWKKTLEVTLETVIPELPKKGDRLTAPVKKDHDVELEKIEQQIQKTLKEYNEFRSEVLNQHKEKLSNLGNINVRDLLKELISKKKEVLKDYIALRDDVNDRKAMIEELFEKSQKYRMQMKKLASKKELEATLEELEERQASETITLQEEKEIMKEIADIKKSLPYAAPLEEINNQMNDLRKDRKVVYDKMVKVRDQLNKYNREIEECQSNLDSNKQNKDDENSKLNPFLETKKKEKDDKINELKELRKKTNSKYYDGLKAYEEQQLEIEKVAHITKIKQRLQRDAERKAREDEENALIEEEEKLANIDPYKEEIDMCSLLIDYCHKLMPQVKGEEQKEEPVEKKDIEAILSSGDYKKEKVTLFTKESEDFFNVSSAKTKGKGKGKSKAKAPKDENKPESLNHKFDVLGFFESLKVAPPMFVAKLPATIEVLKEKKAYFEAQTEKKKPEEEKAEPEKKAEKKQKALVYQEEEFPSI